MSVSAATSARRVVYLDVLRLLATFQMLQGHAIDAVLHPSYRQGSVHALWQHLRGYTAPAFLFASGFAFYLTTLRPTGQEENAPRQRSARAHWRRIRRFGLLIALGYLMHMPPSLGQVWEFSIVDVLQCIGVSLLVLELIAWHAPRARVVVDASVVLMVACFFLEHVGAGWVPSGPLRVVSNYLNDAGGSLFPVLPHGGYVFAGVGAGAWAASGDALTVHVRRLAVLSVLGWVAVAILGQLEINPVRIERLAVVLSLTCVLAWLSRTQMPFGRPWSVLSRQTLFIYLTHVGVLYADPWGVQFWLGKRLGPWGAALFALSIVGGFLFLAVGWDRLTHRGKDNRSRLEPEAASR